MKKTPFVLILALVLVVLAACQPAPTPVPTGVPGPTIVKETVLVPQIVKETIVVPQTVVVKETVVTPIVAVTPTPFVLWTPIPVVTPVPKAPPKLTQLFAGGAGEYMIAFMVSQNGYWDPIFHAGFTAYITPPVDRKVAVKFITYWEKPTGSLTQVNETTVRTQDLTALKPTIFNGEVEITGGSAQPRVCIKPVYKLADTTDWLAFPKDGQDLMWCSTTP